ncbi:MAG TPA: LLM class flavin-dependent oxidoreductase [Thermofilum sp.]|nr:LLM class flavin-dependent oxidoreductase [Thermofilum sp.]
MWTEPEVNFTGKYYKIEGGLNFPKLIQKLHPPILIGGGDEKFTLRVVAMHADKWNYGWGLENYKRKSSILRNYLREYGRDPNDIS